MKWNLVKNQKKIERIRNSYQCEEDNANMEND